MLIIRPLWRNRLLMPMLLGCLLAAPALAGDGDGDGLDDAWESAHFGNLKQTATGDADGDGLTNLAEYNAGTDPNEKDTDKDQLSDFAELFPAGGIPASSPIKADTDGDFLLDGEEVATFKTDPTKKDTDGDGLPDNTELQVTKTNPLQVDTDNGFTDDGTEVLFDHTDPTKPEDDKKDTDLDGLPDWQELNVYKTNRFVPDSDGDGLKDGEEIQKTKTDPNNPDSDGDALKDGAEIAAKTDPNNKDTDTDGLLDGEEVNVFKTDPLLKDTDWDSLSDFDEAKKYKTNPNKADSDGGGLYDPVEVFDGSDPNNAADDKGKDADGDGLSDNYELKVTKTNPADADSDGDFLNDAQDALPLNDHLQTNPIDADTDDDGLLDGKEGGISADGSPDKVTKGTSPLLFDTDGDKLGDGLELGLTTPQISTKHPTATKLPFAGDQDPASTTDPFGFDSDGDTLNDNVEDANGNGKWEPLLGETDPTKKDTDGDGLDDGWEVKYATAAGEGPPLKPLDASDGKLDNDGDGLSNLVEYNVSKLDKDGKVVPNRTNPRAKDSDADGLSDKVEVQAKYGGAPPYLGTDPNTPDTDGDGLTDGLEDKNKNGVTDAGEANPKLVDSDLDGLADGVEDKNKDGIWQKATGETDAANADSDVDGVNDGYEVNFYGTNPNNTDTDGDGLLDGLEVGKKGDADVATTTNPKAADSDGDGLGDAQEDANKNGKLDAKETNPNLADTDADGLSDGIELGVGGDADPATKSDPLAQDSDGDGLYDGTEDANHNGKQDKTSPTAGETDPMKKDTDGGGTPDGVEVGVDNTNPLDPKDDAIGDSDGDGVKNSVEQVLGTNVKNPDTDGDTISDGDETNFGKLIDTDGDGKLDVFDEDSDGDGWKDAEEAGDTDWKTPPLDTNGDGVPDYRSLDSDGDGLSDADEKKYGTLRLKADTDGDGLSDGDEMKYGLSPKDTDSDDDGLADGLESLNDGDGDGLIGALDADSDNDGILDGTESGVTAPMADTDVSKRAFVADADPATPTNPNNGDSDGDGLRDGAEDPNHNGKVDPSESNAADANVAMKLLDSDVDGLPDAEELAMGSDPKDVDSDDDGVPDGSEWNFSCDSDQDGAPNVRDADGDNDGLSDGLERGAASAITGTWLLAGNFSPDADSASTTSPLKADSDGDGLRDGLEDVNGNGRLDPGESDPNQAMSLIEPKDSDGDGLSDAEEARIGSNPADRDSDDDGVEDGLEANALFDSDGDGVPSVFDPDSDNDGLGDGNEAGVATAGKDTNSATKNLRPDADPMTKTLPLARDSDGDGLRDGWEDSNYNGKVDAGESNPLAVDKDAPTVKDTDGDGLNDAEEATIGSRINDADSDDDGIGDADEADAAFDTDRDGTRNVSDEDADADGLFDGTEIGLTLATLKFPKATDLNVTVFVADADPTTRTFPLRKDSDGGGLPDGIEDYSHNGKIDTGETDPGVPSDDGAIDGDLDGDSLDNATELLIGTNPLKADTDGDGLLDPSEVGNPQAPIDTDGDKIIDALDIDSDNDGLQDKDETGLTGPPVLPQGVLDSDGDGKPDFRDTDSDNDTLSDGDEVFKYHTNPRLADSDGGGLNDDIEVLQTQSDPLDARDDNELIERGARLRGTTPLSCTTSNSQGKAGLLLLLLPAAVLLRRRKKLLLVAILLLLPTLAWATVQEPDVTGFRFNVDGQGILTLDAAKQVAPQQLTLGVQMQYAAKPLVSASETQVFRSLVDYRVQMDIGMSMRLFDNLTLCAHLPVSIAQDGTLPSLFGPQSGPITQTSGIADAVVTLKYIFRTEGERRLGFGLLLPVSLPTGTPEQYLGRPGATVSPTALLSAQFGQWRVVGNLGVRLQDETKAFNMKDGSVVRFGAAGSWNPTVKLWTQQNVWFDASLMHETPLAAPFANGANERLEVALALNVPIDDGIYMTLGSSFGLWPGNGVPAYRPMLLIRYAP